MRAKPASGSETGTRPQHTGSGRNPRRYGGCEPARRPKKVKGLICMTECNPPICIEAGCDRRTSRRTNWHTMSERIGAEANEYHDRCQPCHELRAGRQVKWAAMAPADRSLAEVARNSGKRVIARKPWSCKVCGVDIAPGEPYWFHSCDITYIQTRLCMECVQSRM